MSSNMNMLSPSLIMAWIIRRKLRCTLCTRWLNTPRKRRIDISGYRCIRNTTIHTRTIRVPEIDVDVWDWFTGGCIDDLDVDYEIDPRLSGWFADVAADVFAGDIEGSFCNFGDENTGVVSGEDGGVRVAWGVGGCGEVISC